MEHSPTLAIPARYYRVYTEEDVPCDETNFGFVERTLPIPVAESALVLVDLWSTHYIGSWLQRAQEVTQKKIVPLLAAARRVGMTVIHAPSPPVADRYAEPPPPIPSSTPPSAFPPPEFRSLYRAGDYAAFGRDREPRLHAALERYKTELDIAASVQPLPGELVIHHGAQLHDLLAERGALHLFYAGFATNWCVIGRDYGVIAMSGRGYNLVLVRDATTGIEFHDTFASLTATEIAIREIETKYAWSTTTDAFLGAVATLEQTV